MLYVLNIGSAHGLYKFQQFENNQSEETEFKKEGCEKRCLRSQKSAVCHLQTNNNVLLIPHRILAQTFRYRKGRF